MWVGLEALKSQLVRGFVGNSKAPLGPDPQGLKGQPLTRASGSAWSSCIQLPVPVHFQLNFIPFFLLLILREHGVLSKILSHGFFLYPMNWTEMRLCVCIWVVRKYPSLPLSHTPAVWHLPGWVTPQAMPPGFAKSQLWDQSASSWYRVYFPLSANS